MKTSMTVEELYAILANLPRGMRVNIVAGEGRRQTAHAVGPFWIDDEGEAADESHGVLYIGAGRRLGYLPEDVAPTPAEAAR